MLMHLTPLAAMGWGLTDEPAGQARKQCLYRLRMAAEIGPERIHAQEEIDFSPDGTLAPHLAGDWADHALGALEPQSRFWGWWSQVHKHFAKC